MSSLSLTLQCFSPCCSDLIYVVVSVGNYLSFILELVYRFGLLTT
jgi:hypothetical protein